MAYYSRPDSGTWTDVIARFSDTALSYTQSVSCWVSDGKRVMCGVDCDGGSFHVDRREGGIAAGFGKDGGGLSLNQSCGDPDDESGGRWMTSADAGGVVELSTGGVAGIGHSESQPEHLEGVLRQRVR